MPTGAPESCHAAAGAAHLRRALLWPLRPRPLAVLLSVAVLGLSTVIPLLGPILALALVAAVFHSGFRALDHFAHQGRSDGDPLPLRPDADAVVRSVALLLALMAWGALALAAWAFGGLLGGLAGGLLLATVAPAAVVRIGREGALVGALMAALNPVGLVAVMRAAGRPYLAIAAFPPGLAAAAIGVWQALAGPLGLELRLAGGFLLAGYTTLLAFRLAAGLAAAHREALGYAEEPPRPAAPAPAPEAPREPTADERVTALIKADRLGEAAALLRTQVKAHPTSLHWWERYYRLLRHLDRDAPVLAASKGFISALLAAGEEQRAMEVVHDALNRDPAFHPAKPEQVFPLARIARREGRPRLALRTMKGFAQRCPDHPDAPMVLLFAARIVGEDFRKPAEAGQLLDALLRSYADHPLAGEARRLRQGFPQAS